MVGQSMGRKELLVWLPLKTGQAVIVGVYDKEGIQPGNAANTVEKQADYLIEFFFDTPIVRHGLHQPNV